jgi:hypothetical protein
MGYHDDKTDACTAHERYCPDAVKKARDWLMVALLICRTVKFALEPGLAIVCTDTASETIGVGCRNV